MQKREILYLGAQWQLEVVPRREMISRSLSLLPRIVLGGGGVMGVLTGWLIYLLQAASLASKELRRTNELLQADIAERHRAEQALLEREAGLKLAQRVGNVGSWELDLATQQLNWSDQTYRIFGLAPGNFTPTREGFYQLVHPEDRQTLRDHIHSLIHEGNTFDHEFRIILPDGRERILHEQAAPVVMPHSGAVKVVGVVRDITETRLAQQEREKLIVELQEALENVKTLSGLLPICANCKKIRDDKGYWNQIEIYLQKHSDAQFTHGLCPECVRKLYPELYDVPLPGESSAKGPSQPPA
jgi:PAS domain S-box-containing protein